MTDDHSDRARYWESVYTHKRASAVSWYRAHLEMSLALLERVGLSADSRVIDVGGGASTLVDDLLLRGLQQVAVLDLSAASLAVAQSRLGARAAHVVWLAQDVRNVALAPGAYTHWHDRAAMHFLTDDRDVRAYAQQAARAVVPGGHAVIAGFAPDGPEQCSGLPVARRSAQDIAAALSPHFALLESRHEVHRTPGGGEQSFAYALLRRERC